MKKPFCLILVISVFFFSTATVSFAGSRHGYRSYNSHYWTGNSYYHGSSNHNYSRSSHFWGYLGVGMLTGVVIGSVLSQPPRPRTVYYTSSPQVIVQSEPIIIRQQPPPPPPPELVLREVKIIAKIVNIRSGPGLENRVINQALHDERVDVIGAAPDWLYIKTGNGQYGWVMTQYTHETDRPMG